AGPRTAAEMRAALGALAAAGVVGVVPVGARLEGLALAGPSGPVVVVAEPDAPGALAPLMGDLAVAKLGADLKALRVALARRGVALAGPGCAGVLAEMELGGILIDVAALGGLSAEFAAALERLMAEIYALAGMEFNINSPPQLRTVLFERLGISPRGVRRGKTGLSTDVDVLT